MAVRIESSAAKSAVAVTPSDATVVAFEALYIGTTGNVAVTTVANQVVTFTSVPVGFFPVRCTKVMSTNTTATNIVGLNY